MITRTSTIVAAVLAAVLLAAYVILDRLVWHNGLPEGLIQANGRLEAEHIGVASKTPGRIAKLLVREGDKVEAGQPLALLEDVQLKAKADQVAQTEAALQAQLAGAQATLDVTQREVPLGIAAAQAQLARADATLAKAKAAEVQANPRVIEAYLGAEAQAA